MLYRLDDDGPRVRDEDQAGLRLTRRQAAKPRASNARWPPESSTTEDVRRTPSLVPARRASLGELRGSSARYRAQPGPSSGESWNEVAFLNLEASEWREWDARVRPKTSSSST